MCPLIGCGFQGPESHRCLGDKCVDKALRGSGWTCRHWPMEIQKSVKAHYHLWCMLTLYQFASFAIYSPMLFTLITADEVLNPDPARVRSCQSLLGT